MGIIIADMNNFDPLREQINLLPHMATGLRASIDLVPASAFNVRINSEASIVLTTCTSLMSAEELNMMVALRVNREYMKYMRKYYLYLHRSSFNMMITDK